MTGKENSYGKESTGKASENASQAAQEEVLTSPHGLYQLRSREHGWWVFNVDCNGLIWMSANRARSISFKGGADLDVLVKDSEFIAVMIHPCVPSLEHLAECQRFARFH